MYAALILETPIWLIVLFVSASGSVNVKVLLEDTAFYRIKSVGTYFFISFEKRRIALCRPLLVP